MQCSKADDSISDTVLGDVLQPLSIGTSADSASNQLKLGNCACYKGNCSLVALRLTTIVAEPVSRFVQSHAIMKMFNKNI